MIGETEPRQIGTYEVLAKLADGGVGTVYLARRRGPAEFRRLVAIKRLHPQFARDTGFVTMFTDEARLAARIHHANVVSIVELGADADGYYVVMEYVEGSNLGHFHWHATRRDGALPRPISLRIVLDALSGLHAAHEIEGDNGEIVNLVHRDVSPQNILIGTDGLARLGDFGIARATSALRQFETRGAAVKGKLEYMSPEQIESKDVDRTTDLFAMGIVFWELLTGRRLFPAAPQVTTIARVCFDPIPSPRSINPSVTPALERIAMHALERPRERRYPSAAAFAEDLEGAARADCGIATQREVAACMASVLGEPMAASRKALRDAVRAASSASAPIPNVAPALRGSVSTDALPASDPMIMIPSEAHPPVSNERIDTEPFRAAPNMGESAVTVHYEEGAPLEVIAEAKLRSRQLRPADSSDRTLALVDRPGPVPARFSAAPVSSPVSVTPPISVSASSRPPHSAPPPPTVRRTTGAPRWAVALAVTIGLAVAGGLGGLGVRRLAQSRAASRAAATGVLPAPPADPAPLADPAAAPTPSP